MKKSNERNIEKKFDDWFYQFEGRFSYLAEYFYEDVALEKLKQREESMKKWLQTAFKEGYNKGIDDMLEKTKIVLE
jgi:hypothetical protein